MSKERGIVSKMKESRVGKSAMQLVRLEVAKRGSRLYDFEDDKNDFIEEFAQLTKGRFPVIYLNHQSHIDIGPMMEAVDRVNKKLDEPLEYNLPVAVSIKKQQGEVIENYFAAFAPWIEKHNIQLIEVSRNADRQKYNLGKTPETVEELRKTVFGKRGMILFPEGTVEGGRTNKITGEKNGMVEVRNVQLPSITKTSVETVGREVAYLPIGVNGGYNIFDVDNNKIPIDAIKAILLSEMPFVKLNLATAVVGRPFTSQELIHDGIDLDSVNEINAFLMKKVARLLPEEARGYYS